MVACNVLKWTDLMVAVDAHQTIVPPSPTPFPSPYLHASFLGHGVVADKSKYSGSPANAGKKPSLTLNIQPMLQGTDCGFFDVHIGILANVLVPVIIGFSSSKSLFVAGSVQINGSPTAAACLVFMNLNLNCNFPVSLPNGVVYAFSTVQAGMSAGDYLAGIVSGLLQMAIDAIIGKFIKYASGLPISRSINQSINQLAPRLFIRSITSNYHVATPIAAAIGRYLGTSNPIITTMISATVGEGLVAGAQGVALDQTPAEDSINAATSHYLGSNPNDLF